MGSTVLLKLWVFEVWICGLRQDQSVTRTDIKKVELDVTYDLVKINPLEVWTAVDVWDYVRESDIPYIGPFTAGKNIREGRWW